MTNRLTIDDFIFIFLGKGAYRVIYESPKTHKVYKCRTTDMQLVDNTYHSDNPKQKDLKQLKREVKRNYKPV